ncbi:MAG TPA: nuclear transport factor 2 family protein [Gemmatimonadaceae bacterium]|nr:nuclear transport factor 2 family protein [Gemmatimonadaceae bacterium]
MRAISKLSSVTLAVLLVFPATSVAQVSLTARDTAALAAEIARIATATRQALSMKSASALTADSTMSVRTSDGRTLNAAQFRADLQRRMDITTRVDTVAEVLDSVRRVTADSVLTYASQRFVGLVRVPGRPERVLVYTVINERPLVRSRGQWRITGAVREIGGRSVWVDETPAGIAAAVDSVRALDSAWARTYATNDTVLAAAVMGERFLMTSSDGRIKDKATEMGDIRPSADVQMLHFRTSDVRIETFAGAGVVMGVADWAYTSRGQRSTVRRSYAAVYIRGGPLGWQLVSLHMGGLR